MCNLLLQTNYNDFNWNSDYLKPILIVHFLNKQSISRFNDLLQDQIFDQTVCQIIQKYYNSRAITLSYLNCSWISMPITGNKMFMSMFGMTTMIWMRWPSMEEEIHPGFLLMKNRSSMQEDRYLMTKVLQVRHNSNL